MGSTRDKMREKLPRVYCCRVEDEAGGFDLEKQKER